MKVEVQKELADRKPLAEVTQGATRILEETLGDAASRVTATWGFRADDRGSPLIQLAISDTLAGEGSTELTYEEMQDHVKLMRKLSRLWDGVLRNGIRRHIESLEAMGVES